jgi:hypothetical protein
MAQAGLIEVIGDSRTVDQRLPFAIPMNLTWDGYEFLDDAADETVWTKVKEHVMTPARSVGFEVLKALVTAEAKKLAGLS